MYSETSLDSASGFFASSILASAAGIFFCIYFLFIDQEMAIRIATAQIVGASAFLCFFRHSIFYQSGQFAGWSQGNPQFQIEVGLANLSMGGAALAASLLEWGSVASGMTLLVFGLYISCASLLSIREFFHPS